MFKISPFFFVLLLFIVFFPLSYVSAQCMCSCDSGTPVEMPSSAACTAACTAEGMSASCPGIYNTGQNTTGSGGSTVSLTDPLTNQTGGSSVSPQTFIGKIIGAALGIVGSLALLMFIFGGFTWMTSAGSPEKVTKGKSIMVWAAIGLAVIFSSYALVKFVITNLKG